MGFLIDGLSNLFGKVTGVSSNSAGSAIESVASGAASLLSGGEGDTTLFSKIGNDLKNLKSGINEKLTELKESSGLKNMQSKLVEWAEGIDALGIPDKIRDAVRGFREKVVESGVVGKIAQTVLDGIYSVGSKLPVIGPIVSAVQTVLPGSAVETVINKSLQHIEEKFFDPLEDENSDYQKMRKEILEAVSLENITRVSVGLFNTGLNAGIEATKEGASFETVVQVVKDTIDKEITNNEEIEHFSDASPYVGGALKEVGSGVVNSAKAIAQDPDVQAAAKNAIENAPNLLTGAQESGSQLMSIASGLFGKLKF